MALSAELEALLTELEKVDPAGAKEQRVVLEKHAGFQKPIQEALLRQQDYDRKMNASKAEVDAAKKTAADWSDWEKKNRPIHEQLRKDYEAGQAEIDRLKAEVEAKSIAAAAAAGGSGADADKIAAAVKAAIKDAGGMPTAAELAKLISDATDERMKTAKSEFFEKEVPRSMAFQSKVTQAQIKYFRDTGKDLDLTEFAKFLTDGNYADPMVAYEKYMDPINRKKEIETEAQKIADEKIKKFKEESGASGIPGSSGPQNPGHLQIRLTEKKPNDPLFSQDIELGDNAAAMAAAAELRSEGKVA